MISRTLRLWFRGYVSQSSKKLHLCGCQYSYILERDYELPNGRLYRDKLLNRHCVYKVVDFLRGPPELEVILTKDSLEHGVAGEVLSVDKHVGRTLIRNFEAVYASPENINEYASGDVKHSGQTISGRRMLLWLRTREFLTCAMRDDVEWTLTTAQVSRALFRGYRLVVPEDCLQLPNYEIKSSDSNSWGTHNIQITVNGVDTVTLKIDISPWVRKGKKG